MAPLIVQVIATLIARIVVPWRDAARMGMAALFFFTAVSHFAPLKTELAAMIPPPLTGALWVVYLTGVLELAGAIGLLLPRFRRAAAICLVLLLVALLPANIYAALHDVTLRGRPASALWWRIPLQFFWMVTLWWSAIAAEAKGWEASVQDVPERPLD
jgi:uncharacterized membrane protein